MRHPPEGPWVVCTDSKKKTFPTLPDYTMAERKTLTALHLPRTHADTQRLAMVPEFIEGGLRRKSLGLRPSPSQKDPEGGDSEQRDTVASGICFGRLLQGEGQR